MRLVDDYSEIPPFEILAPARRTSPFVFNAPHSGNAYPRSLIRRSRLDRHTIRRSEDTFVDSLFAGVLELGAPMLKANFPRVYLDLNRAANELDPEMFDAPLCVPVAPDSPRVAGGLGVIARIVGERQEIYGGPLPAAEAEHRLSTLYDPYHRALEDLIESTVDDFGACVLVDCHSMPSGAVRAMGEGAGPKPDVILGDRFGTSCAPELTDALAAALREAGFVVGRNRPYAGGYITEHYGRPPLVHAVQLEINRALYMDEAYYTRAKAFGRIQDQMTAVCETVMDAFRRGDEATDWPLAAE